MKLPSMIKQITEAEGESRVYIEDYVYSYLNGLKMRKEAVPLRVALFGYTCNRDSRNFYFVYGAAYPEDEPEDSRTNEQIRAEYFNEYEFLGYVKVRAQQEDPDERGKGYCVFYDTNEAMQNYLLAHFHKDISPAFLPEEREELTKVWQRPKRRFGSLVSGILKNLLYVIGVLLLAVAVTTINEYPRMHGFVETAERAVLASSMKYERSGDE